MVRLIKEKQRMDQMSRLKKEICFFCFECIASACLLPAIFQCKILQPEAKSKTQIGFDLGIQPCFKRICGWFSFP